VDAKTLFSIYLPATLATIEVWVPNHISVSGATKLVCALAASREGNWFEPTIETSLYLMSSGEELMAEMSIGELGLSNGTRLALI